VFTYVVVEVVAGGETASKLVVAVAPVTAPTARARSGAASRSASNATSGRASVEPGDRGPKVRAIQTALATLGYAPGLADGQYGKGTSAAVISFQRDH
jgi:peptidoglycan hydrolase-like protein with peptidoglycan-binding domain